MFFYIVITYITGVSTLRLLAKLKAMKIRVLFCCILICTLHSCRNPRLNAYQYDIEIRANNHPVVPKKFLSYKDVLLYFTFNRHDSSLYNVNTQVINSYTRFDTSEIWIIAKATNICHQINSFTPDFKVIKTDSLKNIMEGSGGRYVFDKELRDSTVNGIQYQIADSVAFNKNDSMIIRYYFVKKQGLNTVYSFLNMGHKNPYIKYAGFTMDDYKNKLFFTNLIVRLKEVDDNTLKLCGVVYKRFLELYNK
jgi:hypothetical protein